MAALKLSIEQGTFKATIRTANQGDIDNNTTYSERNLDDLTDQEALALNIILIPKKVPSHAPSSKLFMANTTTAGDAQFSH